MSVTVKRYEKYVQTGFLAGLVPVVPVRGRGTRLWGEDGKEYLDCYSGISVVNAGHNHPTIVAAARRQMEEMVHAGAYVHPVPKVGELAERLAGIMPGNLQKTFFANSGAEANEGAMRLAKQVTGKRDFVALTHSFHGRTNATLSITGNAARKKGGDPYLPGIGFAMAPDCYRCPLKLKFPSCGIACADDVETAIQYRTSGRVAAFIAEPVLGEGGVIPAPIGYFERVSEILKKHDSLFICDEVQTGFGRSGKMFAIEHEPKVIPDILTMAKGIAGGFPLGAFTVPAAFDKAWAVGDHLSTFGGNAVSCAAGIANLDVMKKENLPGNAARQGGLFLKLLGALARKTKSFGDVRGRGLLIGIDVVSDRKKRTPDADRAKKIRVAAREAGVLLGLGGTFGNVLRIQPPLVIREEEVERVVAVLSKAVGSR